ncbi:MAG: PPC domain-containing protein [Deltaproteobacteria bacterium]|nr:PPC domain-containing protein [Deltaproteobacteria bacterium]MDQ3297884.1 PPC domain-containing protein [Myxococcota bacterium]
MLKVRTIGCAVTAIAAFAWGCSAERPGENKPDDAGTGTTTLDPPAIVETPLTTPRGTVAVRGTTDGARVVVKGGPGDPVVAPVLPTGGFCIDAPLEATGPTSFTVYALKNGLVSPSTEITVTKDSAAPIPSMPQCLGMEQPVCVAEDTASNNCTNDKDDNCNGYTDECEPTCNGCVDDGFGPNWVPFFVPMIADGTYPLQICPCRDDWFAFNLVQGRSLRVRVTFTSTALDLDIKLQTPAAAESNSTVSVARSATTTGIEEFTYVAAATGTYYLKIYSFRDGGTGKYTLTIFP